MAKETKLSIIVDAQNRANRGLSSVKGQLDGLNVTAEKVSSRLKSLGRVGTVAFAALSAGSAKLINDAASSLQIEESYRRMTTQAGISSDNLLKQLKKTSAGTVSSTNLMLSANRAMALGVGEDMETVTTLMEIARLKGRALGLDTTQAFNDIVTGIGRGSPLILDNLGITIKLGEAQEMYAEKLGKSAAELTDAEKKQAVLNAVMESGKKELAEAGVVQTTTAESLQAMKAQFADTADTIGRTLIPAVTQLLEAITPVLTAVGRWVSENPKLTAAIIGATLAISALLVALGGIGLLLPGIITMFSVLAGPIGIIIAIIGTLTLAVWKVIQIMDVLQTQWSDVWLGMKLVAAETANGVIGIIERMINFMLEGVNKYIEGINKVIRKANEVTGLDIGTLNTLDTVSLNRLDLEQITANDLAARSPASVVITGNTFLSEDAAEQMGDLMMDRLKLSNAM